MHLPSHSSLTNESTGPLYMVLSLEHIKKKIGDGIIGKRHKRVLPLFLAFPHIYLDGYITCQRTGSCDNYDSPNKLTLSFLTYRAIVFERRGIVIMTELNIGDTPQNLLSLFFYVPLLFCSPFLDEW